MKRGLFLLLLILLLLPLSAKTRVLALASDSGMEIYMVARKSSRIVTISEETMTALKEASGLDARGVGSALLEDGTLYSTDGESYLERQELYRILLAATSTTTIPEVLDKERKSLKDSSFLSSMERLSRGFDKELLELAGRSRTAFVCYQAEDVMGEKTDYEGAIIFLKRWIKAMIR